MEITEEQQQRAVRSLESQPLARLLGMRLAELRLNEAVVKIDMRDDLRQPAGVLHGGVTATVIDTAMAYAVITRLAEGERATTVDLTVHYLRPHVKGRLTCTARVLRAGRRILTVSAEAVNEDGALVAAAMSTYSKV